MNTKKLTITLGFVMIVLCIITFILAVINKSSTSFPLILLFIGGGLIVVAKRR